MIHAAKLKKVYQMGEESFTALKGIDLTINRGEFVSIMGPSGSGKSTLLHLLGGLDIPTDGTLKIEDVSLASLSEKDRTFFRRRKLGFIFQNYQLLPTMTVEENIAFPMAADRVPKTEQKSRVSELIKAVDLEGKENFFPSQLSGGQQQRVSIARALAMKPGLILADEPTGNLDRKRGKEILQLLSQLHREEGLTIIMVTHDLYAAGYSERVLLLKDGEIKSDISKKEGENSRVMEDLLAKLNA
ncbi:ABC transporter ATP-binding protein [Hazenella coriacea]|uniref:Putative ABC transport system ATP-binding protein n=1 Tax=Hazenella coriacea TaxID=1179467 RepID=A0A4R3L116_9BACL|nr:ABC transporter ATP-binding protein [Hazenella coriacea]TCS92392.1 putative ABC transport system ATP-binding protein [Hazenella coriacea]